jgi:starch synthase
MKRSLKICFAASEAVPYAKTGGLADVAAALPARLAELGHDVRLFLPYYRGIGTAKHEFPCVDSIREVPIQVGPRTFEYAARTPPPHDTAGTVYLIDCPELYDRPTIYTTDADEAQRFTLFSRAVIESCQRMAWAPDVFHCNDWHTALIPFLLRTVYEWDALFRKSRCLLTIHNIGYQGGFSSDAIGELGLDPWAHLLDQDDLNTGRVNFLRTGIIYADAISTVSPTYAKEIQTEEYGMGLRHVLRARRDTLVGILNGVDYNQWSPERDPFIPYRFAVDDLEGKRKNKLYLLERLKLDPDLDAPLLGVVSRLVHQKGFDLCFDVLPDVLSGSDLRCVALGSGEARVEQFFDSLQRAFPRRVCYHRGYHDELAHVIEAASDMLLMPSRYEPCGLNQMFGMRYGTLPIVRRTGGLADSVKAVDLSTGEGTGFVFEHFNPDALRWALDRALATWRDRGLWGRLMRNAMHEDFAWEVRARPYEELYRKLLER